jgi:glucose/arabinose dehydrogenase
MATLRLTLVLYTVLAAACSADTHELRLPDGFSIRTIATVHNARQMALSDEGTLFVGSRRGGSVYAIPRIASPEQGDVITLAKGLSLPTGVAWHNGDLYVGALNRVLVFPDIDSNLHKKAPYRVLTDALPDKSHHGWKYLGFSPEGELYIPVGAPCNVCLEEDERFASLLTMDRETGETTVFARGIRNTVGFAWHPQTGELWFTDNGRDMLGDDTPPDEINRAPAPGLHFGFPYIHAGDIPDPDFADQLGDGEYVAPEVRIQAHSAALGVAFHPGNPFPDKYTNALFVAEHGSWNRSSKVGYQVSVLTFDELGMDYQPFITGWLQGEKNWGRPNDVLVMPDGSLLISDDQADAIYQVTYNR